MLSATRQTSLQAIADGAPYHRVPLRTGDALIRRGLAYRRTAVITRDYIKTEHGETEQLPQSWFPCERHDWSITPTGRAALEQDKPAS